MARIIYIGLAAFVGFAVLANAALYTWRAQWIRQHAGCDSPASRSVVEALFALIGECAASVALVFLLAFGRFLPRCRTGVGRRGAVLLVHGWAGNRGAFWLLRRRLIRDGWSHVCCFEYRPFAVDVERVAGELHAAIDALRAEHGGSSPLVLLGYGLGGLVLRYYLRRYPAAGIRRVLTLGTAHCGTVVARLGGPLTRALVPESPLLRRLNAADHLPRQFDVIAVHSTFDATILPPENGRYPDAFTVELSTLGHAALLFSGKAYTIVAENLAAIVP